MSIIWGFFFSYFLFLHSLCRDRGRFCLCQGTAEQESPGGKEPTGDQEIITQVLQSRVQLARPRDAEEQVVNETKWCNMMVGEILFRTWHEMCLTESHWTRGCTRETWKQPSCCHCWTTKRGQQGRLVRVCTGFASCLSIAFDSVFDERLYFYPGVAKARVVVDENTDPASLNLSNCSVDGTKLGKMFPNLFIYFLPPAAHFFPAHFILGHLSCRKRCAADKLFVAQASIQFGQKRTQKERLQQKLHNIQRRKRYRGKQPQMTMTTMSPNWQEVVRQSSNPAVEQTL